MILYFERYCLCLLFNALTNNLDYFDDLIINEKEMNDSFEKKPLLRRPIYKITVTIGYSSKLVHFTDCEIFPGDSQTKMNLLNHIYMRCYRKLVIK